MLNVDIITSGMVAIVSGDQKMAWYCAGFLESSMKNEWQVLSSSS